MAFTCESPAAVRYRALDAYIRVRCRRCENCMKARRHCWMVRAAHEQMDARRTWFVTLTYARMSRAAILEAASGFNVEQSQPSRLARAAGWYVQTFMKRLRKSGLVLRYMFVAEPHLDGFPHFHGLLHDQIGNTTTAQAWRRKKGVYALQTICPEIETAWSAGTINSELVRDIGAIRYVTKYIAKGRFGRIRASARYGVLRAERDAEEAISAKEKSSKRNVEKEDGLPCEI